jgi:single-stranded DNA-binding protein
MFYCVTEGNALADATLRETSDGKQVANVVIRVDQRVRGGDAGHSDGPTIDYEITVWGKPAETFARSATRGARLVAAGELSVEEYDTGAGSTRIRNRITADYHGISSRFAAAVNTRRKSGQ